MKPWRRICDCRSDCLYTGRPQQHRRMGRANRRSSRRFQPIQLRCSSHPTARTLSLSSSSSLPLSLSSSSSLPLSISSSLPLRLSRSNSSIHRIRLSSPPIVRRTPGISRILLLLLPRRLPSSLVRPQITRRYRISRELVSREQVSRGHSSREAVRVKARI